MSFSGEKLLPVDRLEILVVVDNHMDLCLPPEDRIERPDTAAESGSHGRTLLAEHGLSLLVTT